VLKIFSPHFSGNIVLNSYFGEAVIVVATIDLSCRILSLGAFEPVASILLSQTVNSFVLLGKFLLCGSREGQLFQLAYNDDTHSLTQMASHKLGRSPITFSAIDGHEAVAGCETCYLMSLGKGLELTSILCVPVLSVAYCHGGLMTIDQNSLSFIKLSRPKTSIRTMNLNSSVKCIMFDNVNQVLVASTVIASHSLINIISADGCVFSHEVDELISSCTIWKTGTKRYYAFGASSHISSKGKLLVFQVSFKDNKVVLKLRDTLVLDSPVKALASFIRNYILVACGPTLIQVKIDSNTKKLVVGASVQGRFDINTVIAHEDTIFVCGNADSVVAYQFSDKKFEFLGSDEKMRVSCDCLLLGSSILVGSRDGVHAIEIPSGLRYPLQPSLRCILQVSLNKPIVRIFHSTHSKEILCVGSSGTLHKLIPIERQTYALLRNISELCGDDRRVI
jgi:CPSF A subunit region